MRWIKSRTFWGVVLVVAGVLLLLQAAGVFFAEVVWPVLWVAAGILFLYVFFKDRVENWWAAIPAFALLGLAALVAWDGIWPSTAGEFGATLFFAIGAVGFLAVYLVRHDHWWSIIPGGVLLSLALLVGVSSVAGGALSAGVFLLGLAATFGVLAALPTPEGRMRWPLIPAAILALFGVLVAADAAAVLNYIWPAALILAGLYLILRAFGSGRPGRPA